MPPGSRSRNLASASSSESAATSTFLRPEGVLQT